ncbi:glucoamylase [Sorangium cellulosum]|uniref:glucan 1,4-alpha-glucosidase n=1 Tax=Sorangium cellulosum TaxID=56 RepID=A0A2L0ESS1_SORCE|nr:glycoside hydrolase family 15 protein [Sorangium cellulosum]AUX42353.1 glucoamylase [Sorangium cellulosum]
MVDTERPRHVFMAEESLEGWIRRENARAELYLLRNVSPQGARPGAIIASPSRSNPDYYHHWVRDAGIVVRAILQLYRAAREPAARLRCFERMMEFVDFSRHIQQTAVQGGTGLGEPRFYVDGSPYTGPWGRPQDDGPAIRAIELTHLAFNLLEEGRRGLVQELLYDATLPTGSVIKADLEYTAHRWPATCYDAWEEVLGHHFFTRLLQRKALVEGAALAARLDDPGAAGFYLEQARSLDNELRRHWDPERELLVSILDQQTDPPRSGLDSSVIIATLGGYSIEDHELYGEDLFPVDHEQVLATAAKQKRTFQSLYPINDPARGVAGIAIGRYPEDRYDGYRTDSIGHPWPSLTIGFAMYHYKLAMRYRRRRKVVVTPTGLPFFQGLPGESAQIEPGEELLEGDPRLERLVDALLREGDAFLARVRHHMNPDGSMSEQMNRFTGFQQGAAHLSMNYAAFLLATEMRRYLLSPT